LAWWNTSGNGRPRHPVRGDGDDWRRRGRLPAPKQWLDAANTWLWIGVVALLEFEVRYPQAVARRRSTVIAIAALLYSSLTALVPVWAWRGEWFDAYDAALWLIAFATIEVNMRHIASGESPFELGDKA
jgi:hypothetical protein